MSSCCDPVAAPVAQATFATLFTTGILMSAGHCVGMCGPLIATYHGAVARRTGGTRPVARALVLYNAGRIVSYVTLGLAFGLLGALRSGLGGSAVPAALSILAGLLVGGTGLAILGWAPPAARLESARISRFVVRRILALAGSGSPARGFVVGVANGFLPCGPVIAAAIAAASLGGAARSAGGMLAYGLGTLPVVFAVGLGAGALGAATRRHMVRAGALLLLLTAIQLAGRGAASLGWIPHLHAGQVMIW